MPGLLVIGYVWPEPNSSAAGSRMIQLMEFFKQEGYKITFATTAKETSNMADLSSMGIVTANIKLNDPDFDKFLEELRPEVVLFDRFMLEEQFGWRVDTICPGALKILDTEDLHFLRNARQQAYKENSEARDIYLNADMTKREIAAIYRCDLSLIISEIEMDLLLKEFNLPTAILCYLPFMLDPISDKDQAELTEFDKRQDFISIGNFLHEPNWNAVLYLKEKIWPILRKKLPQAKLNIYGAYPSQKVLNLHNPKENFMVHGWVEDSRVAMQNAKVCLAPIQFGAGIKGKLVEAMANGTPSITTTIGAEGIKESESWSGFIANELNDFVVKAVKIYNDKELWTEYQKRGFDIYNCRFNKEKQYGSFQKILQTITKDLNSHRQLNFTGKMLKHHLHKSTYFMSKFIEEKNRSKN